MHTAALAAGLLAVAVGAAVQGSVGFGLNLIAAPVLALVDTRFVPGPAITAAMLLTLLVVVREHQDLHVGEVRTALVARIPASLLAAATVASLPERGLTLFFGGLVLVAVAIAASGVRLRPTTGTLVVAGALSGFMATATSVGGPPMAIVYAGEKGPRMRATISGFFTVGGVISLIALAAVGEYGSEEVRLSGLLVVPIVAGFALSTWGKRWIDRGYTRPAVLTVSAVAALAAIVKALV